MSDAQRSARAGPPFTGQFQPDGDGYVYRKSYRGPAIRVSAEERDGFVRRFHLGIAVLVVATMTGVLAVVVLVAMLRLGRPDAPLWVFAGASAVTVATVAGWLALWNAPDRALAGRPELAPPLSKAEARRTALAHTSWAPVFIGVWFATFLATRGIADTRMLPAWVWWTMSASLLALSGWLALQKLRSPKAGLEPPAA